MSSLPKNAYSVLIFIVILILGKIAIADQFITKSNILKNTDIKIFVGENQKEAVVFHNRDITIVCTTRPCG